MCVSAWRGADKATKTNIAGTHGDQIAGERAVLAKLTMAELRERWRIAPPSRMECGWGSLVPVEK